MCACICGVGEWVNLILSAVAKACMYVLCIFWHLHGSLTGSEDECCVSFGTVDLLRRDFRSLAGTSWLNDEIVNGYMRLLIERAQLPEFEGPKLHMQSTFFYKVWLQTCFVEENHFVCCG